MTEQEKISEFETKRLLAFAIDVLHQQAELDVSEFQVRHGRLVFADKYVPNEIMRNFRQDLLADIVESERHSIDVFVEHYGSEAA